MAEQLAPQLKSLSEEIDELHTRLLEVDAIVNVLADSLSDDEAVKLYALKAASRELLRVCTDLEPKPLLTRHGLIDSPAQVVANG